MATSRARDRECAKIAGRNALCANLHICMRQSAQKVRCARDFSHARKNLILVAHVTGFFAKRKNHGILASGP